MSSDTYRWLAKYYDHLFEFRRPFESARKRIVDPLLPRIESACDLGCGTGTFAVLLARRGIVRSAVNFSPDLCRPPRKKAGGAAVSLKVIQADMRDFQLPQPVNLITCEFDALNHVPAKRDLRRVLRSVRKALLPGG